MGNVFHHQSRNLCRWYPTPAALVDAGHLREVSASGVRLYMVLLRLAQKHSAVEIELPAYELRDYTGLDHKSTTKAGRELEQIGLIRLKKVRSGRVATYQLVNPETGQALPIPEGRRGTRKHIPNPERNARTTRTAVSSKAPKNTATQSGDVYPLSWDEIGSRNRPPAKGEVFPAAIGGKFPTKTGSIPGCEGKDFQPCVQKQKKTEGLGKSWVSETISEREISEREASSLEPAMKIPNKATVCPKCLQLSVTHYSDGTRSCDHGCDRLRHGTSSTRSGSSEENVRQHTIKCSPIQK